MKNLYENQGDNTRNELVIKAIEKALTNKNTNILETHGKNTIDDLKRRL